MQPEDVLQFWFEEATPADWFTKNDEFDTRIREKFLDTYGQIMRGEKAGWRETPRGRLAEIIVLDQFARNMFRNDPRSFEGDELVLKFAQEAVQKRDDRELSGWQRYFLYLPYMHSESKKAHRRAVWFFLRLPLRMWKSWLSYELAHKKVIDRFGRYPHRNVILGRASTPEEQEFLKTHAGW